MKCQALIVRECKSLPSLPYIFLLTIINISLGIWRVGWQRKRIIQNSFRSSRSLIWSLECIFSYFELCCNVGDGDRRLERRGAESSMVSVVSCPPSHHPITISPQSPLNYLSPLRTWLLYRPDRVFNYHKYNYQIQLILRPVVTGSISLY